jgi:signal transduction histidine kinase
MNQMVRDLLEYTRSNMGAGIPLSLENANLARIISASLAEVQPGYPLSSFPIATEGDLIVDVDPPRMQQAITNLLINAVQHGNRRALSSCWRAPPGMRSWSM